MDKENLRPVARIFEVSFIRRGGASAIIVNPAPKQLNKSAVFNAIKNQGRHVSVLDFQWLHGLWPRRACSRIRALLTRQFIDVGRVNDDGEGLSPPQQIKDTAKKLCLEGVYKKSNILRQACHI